MINLKSTLKISSVTLTTRILILSKAPSKQRLLKQTTEMGFLNSKFSSSSFPRARTASLD
jgi:hypothetical protein